MLLKDITEYTLPNGVRLSLLELVLIELLRQRRSETYIRRALAMDQNQVIRVARRVGQKLGVALTSTIREAAKRHGIPRIEDLVNGPCTTR